MNLEWLTRVYGTTGSTTVQGQGQGEDGHEGTHRPGMIITRTSTLVSTSSESRYGHMLGDEYCQSAISMRTWTPLCGVM